MTENPQLVEWFEHPSQVFNKMIDEDEDIYEKEFVDSMLSKLFSYVESIEQSAAFCYTRISMALGDDDAELESRAEDSGPDFSLGGRPKLFSMSNKVDDS